MIKRSYDEESTVLAAGASSETKQPSRLIDYSKPDQNRRWLCPSQRSMGPQHSISSCHFSACRTRTASWLKANNLRMSASQHEMVSFGIRHGGRTLQELPEDESSSSSEDDEQPRYVDKRDQGMPSDSPVKQPMRQRSILHTSIHSHEHTSLKPASQENVNSVVKNPETLQANLGDQASYKKDKKSKSAAKLGDYFAKETRKEIISSLPSIRSSSTTSRNRNLTRARSVDGANSVLMNMRLTSRGDVVKHQKSLLDRNLKPLRRCRSDDGDALKALQYFLKKPARNVNHIIKPTTPVQKRNAPSRSASEHVQPVSPKRSILCRSMSAQPQLNIHFSPDLSSCEATTTAPIIKSKTEFVCTKTPHPSPTKKCSTRSAPPQLEQSCLHTLLPPLNQKNRDSSLEDRCCFASNNKPPKTVQKEIVLPGWKDSGIMKRLPLVNKEFNRFMLDFSATATSSKRKTSVIGNYCPTTAERFEI